MDEKVRKFSCRPLILYLIFTEDTFFIILIANGNVKLVKTLLLKFMTYLEGDLVFFENQLGYCLVWEEYFLTAFFLVPKRI